jgi:peptide/nickel transport system permease protein
MNDRRLTAALAVCFALAVGYDTLVPGPTVALGPFVWDVRAIGWLSALAALAGLRYAAVPLARNPRLARTYWRRFRRDRAALAGAGFLAVVAVLGVLGPLFVAEPRVVPGRGFQPPLFFPVEASVPLNCLGPVTESGGERLCHGTLAHPLGTTGEGTDLLALVVLGARVSLQVALVTTLLVATLGGLVGTVAAYAGGATDELLMRYVDLQGTFPSFFLFLVLSYFFEPSLFLLVVLFGALGWENTARLVRAEALQRVGEPYVRAASAAGAGPVWVLRKHVLPNVSNTVVVNATLLVPSFLLLEAALSFLGLTDPGVPSWGRTVAAGRGDLTRAPWVATVPGLALFCTVLAVNFLGDGLRDALDPREGKR